MYFWPLYIPWAYKGPIFWGEILFSTSRGRVKCLQLCWQISTAAKQGRAFVKAARDWEKTNHKQGQDHIIRRLVIPSGGSSGVSMSQSGVKGWSKQRGKLPHLEACSVTRPPIHSGWDRGGGRPGHTSQPTPGGAGSGWVKPRSPSSPGGKQCHTSGTSMAWVRRVTRQTTKRGAQKPPCPIWGKKEAF